MSVESSCWAMHDAQRTLIPVDLPCGVTNSTHPHVTCCVNGSYCLSNSMCTYVREDGSQGYYNADCTDPTLNDPICGTRCGGRPHADLVYNPKSGFWACCYNNEKGEIDCDEPSDELYPLPPPADLTTIQYLPKTASGTPTYATGGSPSTAAATITASPDSSSLGVGETAGIGAGVGVGVVLIAAVIFFFLFRRRKASENVATAAPYGYDSLAHPQSNVQDFDAQRREHQIYELDRNEQQKPELDSQPA